MKTFYLCLPAEETTILLNSENIENDIINILKLQKQPVEFEVSYNTEKEVNCGCNIYELRNDKIYKSVTRGNKEGWKFCEVLTEKYNTELEQLKQEEYFDSVKNEIEKYRN